MSVTRIQQTIAERVKTCWVYVVQDGEFCKVGMAQSVDKRLSDLALANPRPLAVAAKFRFEDRQMAQEVEGFAHRELLDHNVRGEWYSVEPEKACDAIRVACAQIGTYRFEVDSAGGIVALGYRARPCGTYTQCEEARRERVLYAENDNAERRLVAAT